MLLIVAILSDSCLLSSHRLHRERHTNLSDLVHRVPHTLRAIGQKFWLKTCVCVGQHSAVWIVRSSRPDLHAKPFLNGNKLLALCMKVLDSNALHATNRALCRSSSLSLTTFYLATSLPRKNNLMNFEPMDNQNPEDSILSWSGPIKNWPQNWLQRWCSYNVQCTCSSLDLRS